MAKLTDVAIKHAIKDGRQRRMSDGDGRGTGRLVLVLKPRAFGGMTSDWYVQRWNAGKRATTKIGSYPGMPLARARERFIEGVEAREKYATLRELIDAYIASLRRRAAPSADDIEKRLNKFIDHVGADKAARDITGPDVVAFLRPTYQRGKASLADHDRSFVRAAFAWGLKSDLDYRTDTQGRRFGLAHNPAADIPSGAKVVGTRWLEEAEYLRFYQWLGAAESRLTPSYSVAIRVIMLTGQRVQEIAGLGTDQWKSAERVLEWPTTKNGRPHLVPVCSLAAELLDTMPVDGPWLFPMPTIPERRMDHGALYSMIWRSRDSIGLPPFALRDLRRTWKTLAARAGLSKWERDLLQNHARTDVSSVHYDRHDYLAEKREAVAKWGEWVNALLVRD